MKHGLADLLIMALAAFRLTHLVVFDKIAEPLRRPLLDRPFVGTLVSCFWCSGIWVSAGLMAGRTWWPDLFGWITLMLAVAGGQALIESWVQQLKKQA